MYVDAISDQSDLTDVFSADEKKVSWCGREVYESKEVRLEVLCSSDLSDSKWSLSGKQIKPMMSGGAKVSGEVDKEGNFSIKVEVSTEWGGSKSDDKGGNNTSSSENVSSDSPPARGDEGCDNN